LPKAGYTDEEFIRLFSTVGATETAKILGTSERNIYARRRHIEKRQGLVAAPGTTVKQYPESAPLTITNGEVLIGSDFHIWPGEASTCLRAFKKSIDDIRPAVVILNGDVLDLAAVSRHPALNWEKVPLPIEEIEAVQDHLNDIVKAARKARKIWTLGNHDARFEMRLASVAPEFRGIKGIHLHDHFALWERGYYCRINEGVPGGDTVCKHRLGGGKHAPYNNILKAGVSIVTGHLHNQQVRAHSDYRHYSLYGMDTGCVADKRHSSFKYTEGNPLDWREGYGLLTYRDSKLLPPELFTKWDDKTVVFRGQLKRV
jgi:hypothetical protein